MNILGISGGVMQGNMDGAAALLIDGKLVFAQEEERFTRGKHAVGLLPLNAVSEALKYASIGIRDIDTIVFHADYKNFSERLSRYFKHHYGYSPPVSFVNHHRAHAASAYYASGFHDAMIVTADLSGDGISTTLSYGKDREIKTLRTFPKPQSLGIFYSVITQALGFQRDNDEYKVMGMASYGKPTIDLDWLLRVENGNYTFNEDAIVNIKQNQINPSKQEPLYSNYFINNIGFIRNKNDPYDEKHFNLASSAQYQLNRAAVAIVRELHKETGSYNLCIAGGVGLNCVMNQSLLAMDEVNQLFVQPASSDAGAALGAAYEYAIQQGEKLAQFPGAHIGNEFTANQIREEVANIGVPFEEVANPEEQAAKAIANGKIVGWFQGRHEFGPRALGARSILADPRRTDMKDLINIRVKFREEFRPFAPSVLEEYADFYFISNGHSLPYMAVTVDVRSERKEDLPAVVHVDNTSRIQTVNHAVTPQYYNLISKFKEITGVPVVLNTSFNVKGQPNVNTPTQAIGTLFGSGMDMAFIGPYKVEKK